MRVGRDVPDDVTVPEERERETDQRLALTTCVESLDVDVSFRTLANTALVVMALLATSELAHAAPKDDYLECVQTNRNCEYGTSAACEPSVPPTGPFSQGGLFARARLTAERCNDKPWSECVSRVLDALPKDTVVGYARELRQLKDRWSALAPRHKGACQRLSDELNEELLRQTRFWCGNRREDCAQELEIAERISKLGDELHTCVYYGEFHAEREKLAQARIDQCAAWAGWRPPESEIALHMRMPPLPSQPNDGVPKSPPPARGEIEGRLNGPRAEGIASETAALVPPPDDKMQPRDRPTGEELRRQAEAQAKDESERRRERMRLEQERRMALLEKYQAAKREADEANRKRDERLLETTRAFGHGGDSLVGSTWHVHRGFGIGFAALPIYTDTERADRPPSSDVEHAYGIGPALSVEYWPLIGPNGGVGGFADALTTGTAVSGGRTWVIATGVGLRSFWGDEAGISLLGELGFGTRAGGSSYDSGAGIVESYTVGSASYEILRGGLGARLCSDTDTRAKSCSSAWSISVLLDAPRFEGAGTPVGGRLEWAGRASMRWRLEGAMYPPEGDPESAVRPKRQLFLGFSFESTWDNFGSPRNIAPTRRAARPLAGFVSSDGSFSAFLPRRRSSAKRELSTDRGIVRAEEVRAEGDDGANFVLSSIDFPPGLLSTAANAVFDDLRDGAVAGVPAELTAAGGTVVSETDARVGDFLAREVVIQRDARLMYLLATRVHDRILIALADIPADGTPRPEALEFLYSLNVRSAPPNLPRTAPIETRPASSAGMSLEMEAVAGSHVRRILGPSGFSVGFAGTGVRFGSVWQRERWHLSAEGVALDYRLSRAVFEFPDGRRTTVHGGTTLEASGTADAELPLQWVRLQGGPRVLATRHFAQDVRLQGEAFGVIPSTSLFAAGVGMGLVANFGALQTSAGANGYLASRFRELPAGATGRQATVLPWWESRLSAAWRTSARLRFGASYSHSDVRVRYRGRSKMPLDPPLQSAKSVEVDDRFGAFITWLR